MVVGEKNQDFYTWYGSSRTPRKIDTVIQGNFGHNTEKRKRRKRNREKRKKKDHGAKRILKPLLDPNIPLGKESKTKFDKTYIYMNNEMHSFWGDTSH